MRKEKKKKPCCSFLSHILEKELKKTLLNEQPQSSEALQSCVRGLWNAKFCVVRLTKSSLFTKGRKEKERIQKKKNARKGE